MNEYFKEKMLGLNLSAMYGPARIPLIKLTIPKREYNFLFGFYIQKKIHLLVC